MRALADAREDRIAGSGFDEILQRWVFLHEGVDGLLRFGLQVVRRASGSDRCQKECGQYRAGVRNVYSHHPEISPQCGAQANLPPWENPLWDYGTKSHCNTGIPG